MVALFYINTGVGVVVTVNDRYNFDMPRSQKQRERDEYTVVLEDIRDSCRAFGEAQQLLVEKMQGVEKKLDKMEVDGDFVKTEVRLIRREQVSRDEFDLLEKRVSKIEKRIVVA